MERLWMLLNFRKGHDQGSMMKDVILLRPDDLGKEACDEKEKNKGKLEYK